MAAVRFDVLTLFPRLFSEFALSGLIGKAAAARHLELVLHDLCQWAKTVKESGTPTCRGRADDRPFGGGDGVILKPEPIGAALDEIRKAAPGAESGQRPVIFLTPDGEKFTNEVAQDLAQAGGAILICGRYGGIDERIRTLYVDREISIGDYVLMGGEIPAMAVIEATARFIPGVLGNEASAVEDSFQGNRLEGPQYTRPREFRGLEVPEVLLSGDHEAIADWREEASLAKTAKRRPDLLQKG